MEGHYGANTQKTECKRGVKLVGNRSESSRSYYGICITCDDHWRTRRGDYTEEFLQEAELQAAHIKSSLQNGVVFDRDNIDQCSDPDSSDGRGSSLLSPSPSTNTSSDL
jgi:hypothetical protein